MFTNDELLVLRDALVAERKRKRGAGKLWYTTLIDKIDERIRNQAEREAA